MLFVVYLNQIKFEIWTDSSFWQLSFSIVESHYPFFRGISTHSKESKKWISEKFKHQSVAWKKS
jgi:hypothetical protein